MATGIFNALKYIPASVGIKYLEKVSPKFKNYFAQVAAFGLDANRAFDYLKDRFENEATSKYKSQLEAGEQRGQLRPDELAAKTQIANSEIPGKILRSAAALGTGFSLGGNREEPMQEEQAQPQQQIQQAQEPPSARSQARSRLNEMQKDKKLIEQLQAEFESKYGQRPPASPEFPTGRQQAPMQQPSRQGSGDAELIAAMERILKM